LFKLLSFTTHYERNEMRKPLHKHIQLHYTNLKRNGRRGICTILYRYEKHTGHSQTYLQRKHREYHRFYFTTVERSALTRVMYDPHLFVCLVVTLEASLPPSLSPFLILDLYIRVSLQAAHSLLSRHILLGFGLQAYKAFNICHKEEKCTVRGKVIERGFVHMEHNKSYKHSTLASQLLRFQKLT